MDNKEEFLSGIANNYMNKAEQMFISKYSFEGDDGFGIFAQRLFLRTIFREGQAAIVALSTLEKSVRRYYPYLDKNVGIGNNGVVECAYVHPAWLNYSGSNYGSFAKFIKTNKGNDDEGNALQIKNIDENEVVFFQNHFGEDVYNGQSLEQMLRVFVKEIAARHLTASLYNTIAGGKIATSTSPEINEQIETTMYEPGETIKVNTGYDNDTDKGIKVSEVIDEEMSLIKFDTDPTVFLDGIPKYEAIAYKIFGIKINQRFKKERVINAEMENEDHEFNAADFNLRQAYKQFTIDYKKKFNKDLVIIDNLASVDEEKPEEKTDGIDKEMEVGSND